jgi:hypothetical protein
MDIWCPVEIIAVDKFINQSVFEINEFPTITEQVNAYYKSI